MYTEELVSPSSSLLPQVRLFVWLDKIFLLFLWLNHKNVKYLADWLIGWLTDWLNNWLTDLLIDWLIDWLFDWLTDWLIDWLTDWLIDWLADWLIDRVSYRLNDWLNNWLMHGVHDLQPFHESRPKGMDSCILSLALKEKMQEPIRINCSLNWKIYLFLVKNIKEPLRPKRFSQKVLSINPWEKPFDAITIMKQL